MKGDQKEICLKPSIGEAFKITPQIVIDDDET
jgi:hypothetical protein